jgi:hypothetical protein
MIEALDKEWIRSLVHDIVAQSMETEREIVVIAMREHEKGDDHLAFRAFITDLDRKQARWDKITTSVIGAMIIGVLYWVGSHTIDIASWIVRSAK